MDRVQNLSPLIRSVRGNLRTVLREQEESLRSELTQLREEIMTVRAVCSCPTWKPMFCFSGFRCAHGLTFVSQPQCERHSTVWLSSKRTAMIFAEIFPVLLASSRLIRSSQCVFPMTTAPRAMKDSLQCHHTPKSQSRANLKTKGRRGA